MAVTQAIHPLCGHCKQPVTGIIIQAMGKTFHEDHLICSECNNPIKERIFNVHDKRAVCKECYGKKFSKRCAECGEIIKDFVLIAKDKAYHKKCFLCTSCKTPLSEGFYEKKNNPYCRDCGLSLFSHRCKECNQPIDGTALVAMGARYHPNCFRCSKCREPVTGETFLFNNNEPTCMRCANKEIKSPSDGKHVQITNDDVKNDEGKNDQIKNDQVKSDQVKNDQVKTNEVKNDEDKNDEPKNDEVKNDELKNDQVKNDEIKNDEVKIDDSKNDEAKNDESKNGEATNDEAKIDEAKNDEAKSNEVKNEEGKSDEGSRSLSWLQRMRKH